MSALRFTSKFHVRPGKGDDFRKAVEDIASLVEASEPGTVIYEFYEAPGGGSGFVHEHYQDSDAFLAHVRNTGHLFGPLMQAAEFSDTIIAGSPSDEVQKMFSGGDGHGAVAFFAPMRARP